jgi:hypothetical protein
MKESIATPGQQVRRRFEDRNTKNSDVSDMNGKSLIAGEDIRNKRLQ